ncbi:uncharacterized protein EV422DRAFT_141765 [Fimicolochytrium jonesii]|uniref:uncharacterized protein n=1 Tax=Fimicolochytrium jonesii TaxID=1396493 RepID=UPI0022FE950E|nr:uncharacterized protein EV422DRAFT_141765 [Fimicolochytrium jonesii]KAI8825810.1 hypothetical protein EV422DRAFT_141765 [Fimicolochytrium jonesii]
MPAHSRITDVSGSRPQKDSDAPDPAYDADLHWLHCGRCFSHEHAFRCPVGGVPRAVDDVPGTTTYYVTNCAHIVCNSCLLQENSENVAALSNDAQAELLCPICGQKTAVVELRTEVPEEVERIFIPAIVHLEDAVKVWQFQNGNAVKLLRHLKIKNMEYSRKYREATRALQKAKDEVRLQDQEIRLLKEERDRLKSGGGQKTPATYVSPHSGTPGKNSTGRPQSSRSVCSSPSGRPNVQTPNPPQRLSLPSNARDNTTIRQNGSSRLNSIRGSGNWGSTHGGPEPMDMQQAQPDFMTSQRRNSSKAPQQPVYSDLPVHNSTNYARQPMNPMQAPQPDQWSMNAMQTDGAFYPSGPTYSSSFVMPAPSMAPSRSAATPLHHLGAFNNLSPDLDFGRTIHMLNSQWAHLSTRKGRCRVPVSHTVVGH